MDAKTYAKVTVVNLAVLAFGCGLGWMAHEQAWVVSAQRDIEYVSPNLSTGSALFGTVMAGRVATDQVIVRDVDLLKFMENTVTYLSQRQIGSVAGWNGVIADSRTPRSIHPGAPAAQKKEEAQKKEDLKK